MTLSQAMKNESVVARQQQEGQASQAEGTEQYVQKPYGGEGWWYIWGVNKASGAAAT